MYHSKVENFEVSSQPVNKTHTINRNNYLQEQVFFTLREIASWIRMISITLHARRTLYRSGFSTRWIYVCMYFHFLPRFIPNPEGV